MLPGTKALQDATDAAMEALAHDTRVQLHGGAGVGKSSVLAEMAKRMRRANELAILLQPPAGAYDVAECALVQLLQGLRQAGLVQPQEEDFYTSPEHSFARKLSRLAPLLSRVTVLMDEPENWAAGNGDSFANERCELVIRAASTAARTVTSGVSVTGTTQVEVNAKINTRIWLESEEAWGVLAGAARGLASLSDRLGTYTPLEIRILVGVAALSNLDSVASIVARPHSRAAIVRSLVAAIRQHPEATDLERLWGMAALVRGPIDHDLQDEYLRTQQSSDFIRALFERCITYPDQGSQILHDLLRVDVGHVLDSPSAPSHHVRLAHIYHRRFQRDAGHPHRLMNEMEAHHHAVSSGKVDLLRQMQTFFGEQLHELGRLVSKGALRRGRSLEAKEQFLSASAIFDRCIAWDEGDAYAHHYVAYNMDLAATHPEKTEKHYVEAIRLSPHRPWWHCRYIKFLIARHRIDDARRAWDAALDLLEPPYAHERLKAFYAELHADVVRTLIACAEIDWAAEILETVPPHLAESFRELSQELESLLAARDELAVLPINVDTTRAWNSPLLTHFKGRKAIQKWMEGRVVAVSEDSVDLVVGMLDPSVATKPQYGELSIARAEFDRLAVGLDAEMLEAALPAFVEIAQAVDGEQSIMLHEQSRRAPEVNAFPDPFRYSEFS